MRIRLATQTDVYKIRNAVRRKNLLYCTPYQIADDFTNNRLYCVYEGDKVLATFSLVYDFQWDYVAIKRLCILNKKNQGKGIARFAIHEILRYLHNCKVGATPWEDNIAVRHILEAEGFKMEYKFDGHWCFYSKEM